MSQSNSLESNNPYDPPRAPLHGPEMENRGTPAELTRREYLRREYNLKMLGMIAIVCAALESLTFARSLYKALGNYTQLFELATQSPGMCSSLMQNYLFLPIEIAVLISIGLGLLRLRPWGFWILVGHSGILFLLSIIPYITPLFWGTQIGNRENRWIFLVCGVAQLSLLVYTLASKSYFVVTPEYRNIVLETPFMRRWWNWTLVGFIPIIITILCCHDFIAKIVSWVIARAFFPDWPGIWNH